MKYFAKIVVVLLVLTWTVTAQSAIAKPAESDPGVSRVADISIRATPQFGALIAQAQTKGAVRVIVGLRTSYQPEGRLRNAQAIQAQRSAISQVQDRLINEMANRNFKALKKFASIPHLVAQVDAAGLDALASSPNVASITPDRLRQPSLMYSVPLIGASNAWASGYTGAGQVVAILDSGVDKTHPFLSGKVVSEACYSTTYSPDSATSLCPGSVAQSTDPGSGVPCTGSSECIHGTHVAGIAAGKDNGSIGFSGVAKDANIISIQIYSYFSTYGLIEAYDSDILSGMERVQTLSSTYNIAAINLSLGGGTYDTQAACDGDNSAYKDMIANLSSIGIATVIAAGNEGATNALDAPGCVSGAISVGATTDGSDGYPADHVSYFSDSASFLALLAPGQNIDSSIPGGGYTTMSGTSMATPHVTGTWAVLKSAQPSATVDRVLAVLELTGNPVTDLRNGITKPRIQVDAAAFALLSLQQYYFPIVIR